MPKEKTLDTMTVGELKAYLEEFPDTAKVVFAYNVGDYWRTQAVGTIKSAEYANAVPNAEYGFRVLSRDDEDKDEEDQQNDNGRTDKVEVLVLS